MNVLKSKHAKSVHAFVNNMHEALSIPYITHTRIRALHKKHPLINAMGRKWSVWTTYMYVDVVRSRREV